MTQPFDEVTNMVGTDQGYAWSWYCNLALVVMNASKGKLSHTEAMEVAAQQMLHLFRYDITVLDEYVKLLAQGEGLTIHWSDPDPELTFLHTRGLLTKKK